MTMAGASGSGTPSAGVYYSVNAPSNAGPFVQCAAGNNVAMVVATSQAGSAAVTGTIFITGFYTQ